MKLPTLPTTLFLASLVLMLGHTPSFANRSPALTRADSIAQIQKELGLEQEPTLERKERTNCKILRFMAGKSKRKSSYNCQIGSYLHFNARPRVYDVELARSEGIRIGSFNLLHSGDRVGRTKNYSIVAKMMNQWDVVSAIELASLPKTRFINRHNNKIDKLIHSGDFDPDKIQDILANYVMPGYYQLLRALWEEGDKSWGLILVPEGLGEGTHKEMVGFYYRGRKVQPHAVAFLTGKSKAGTLNLRGKFSDYSKFVSRKPFVGGFQSGCSLEGAKRGRGYTFHENCFKFTLVGVHSRFKASPDAAVAAAAIEFVDKMAPGFVKMRTTYKARLAELLVNLLYLQELKKRKQVVDPDIIILGDFNLPFEVSTRLADGRDQLMTLLPGFEHFVNDRTSVSSSRGLSMAYDHFILNRADTSECNLVPTDRVNGPHSLNFTLVREVSPGQEANLSEIPARAGERQILGQLYSSLRVLKEINDSIKASTSDVNKLEPWQVVQNYYETWQPQERVYWGLSLDEFYKVRKPYVAGSPKLLDEKRTRTFFEDLHRKTIATLDDSVAAFNVLLKIVSDHVPIEMSCKTDGLAWDAAR